METSEDSPNNKPWKFDHNSEWWYWNGSLREDSKVCLEIDIPFLHLKFSTFRDQDVVWRPPSFSCHLDNTAQWEGQLVHINPSRAVYLGTHLWISWKVHSAAATSKSAWLKVSVQSLCLWRATCNPVRTRPTEVCASLLEMWQQIIGRSIDKLLAAWQANPSCSGAEGPERVGGTQGLGSGRRDWSGWLNVAKSLKETNKFC